MSLQVFLQAQLLGSEEFLAAHSTKDAAENAETIGRCAWLSLLCEVLPRALLNELKLSRLLLGSSSAEQFLLVLAEEDIPRADHFLESAAQAISHLSQGALRLVWASTENLGAWPVARKRLADALLASISAPLGMREETAEFLAPFTATDEAGDSEYFQSLAHQLPSATSVGWSTEKPGHLSWNEGQYTWRLAGQSGEDEGILFPQRYAMNDAGTEPATLSELAARADGTDHWGILRGDVDRFGQRLGSAGSIEDHIHLSVLYKEFFAGELSILCTLPDFWRKVSILYRGGDSFAVLGSWDALLELAREIERLFQKFVEHNLQSFPNLEAKSISMALAIAPEIDTPLATVFEEAGAQLRGAKSSEAGTFHVFGRILEWKRLGEAEELKTSLVRLVKDFRYPPVYINDLASVYRESFSSRANRRGKAARVDKPWRTYMRVSRVIPAARGKESVNARNAVITNLIGKNTAGLKLRPSARVGLEWARLAAGN